MNNSIDLQQITDVQELKALKADQYDTLENAKAQIQQAQANLQAVNTRLAQLRQGAQPEEAEVVEAEANLPVEDAADEPEKPTKG